MNWDNIEEQFADRLIKLRMAKGDSARAMSQTLGQNDNFINNIENKKNYPTMANFFNLCQYLEITPMEFFDFDNQNPEELRELIDNLKKLDSEQIGHIEAIVKAFIKSNKFPVRYMD